MVIVYQQAEAGASRSIAPYALLSRPKAYELNSPYTKEKKVKKEPKNWMVLQISGSL